MKKLLLIASAILVLSIGANAADSVKQRYTSPAPLSSDFLGFFEGTFDGSATGCSKDGRGGNPHSKIEVSSKQIRFIRETLQKNFPTMKEPVCRITKTLQDNEGNDGFLV